MHVTGVWLTQDTFNDVWFLEQNIDLISLHKYKPFFPLCLNSFILIFIFTFLGSMVPPKNTWRKNDLMNKTWLLPIVAS
jgi:uncharacterized protein YqhQ